eukprot:5500330-Pleurochrysis_carterae.AAC.1
MVIYLHVCMICLSELVRSRTISPPFPCLRHPQVATPIIQLLRLMDGNMPCMGKIYYRMFVIGQAINDSNVPWKDDTYYIHMDRWEYLLLPFHAVGYALDPEFVDAKGDTDDVVSPPPLLMHATQTGLMGVVERLCLLECLRNSPDPDACLCTISVDDVDVQEMSALAIKQFMKYCEREGIFTKESVMLNAKLGHACGCVSRRAELVYLRADQVEDAQQARAGDGGQLVFGHEALHLRKKLQPASYIQAAAPWDKHDGDDNNHDDNNDDDGGERKDFSKFAIYVLGGLRLITASALPCHRCSFLLWARQLSLQPSCGLELALCTRDSAENFMGYAHMPHTLMEE